jgi:hypothetical protein
MTTSLNIKNLKFLGDPRWHFPHTLASLLDLEWQPFEYLVKTSKAMAGALASGNGRILLCWHPRGGKTLLVTYTVIWFLNFYPQKSIIFSSHNEDFSRARVRTIRDIISGNQNLLRIQLAEDHSRADEFYTTKGGGLLACGIGSGLIGRSADLLVIDDIYGSHEDSQNPRVQRRVEEWFTGTGYPCHTCIVKDWVAA